MAMQAVLPAATVFRRQALNQQLGPPDPTHIMPSQQDMADAFRQDGDYEALMCAIERAERDLAPNSARSRILTRGSDGWKNDAMFCLTQLDKDVLLAILDNTLPQHMVRTMAGALRDPFVFNDKSVPSCDPVVYVNYICDDAGKGLSIAEMEDVLKHLELAVRTVGSTRRQDAFEARLNTAYRDLLRGKALGSRAAFSSLFTNALTNNVTKYVDAVRQNVLPLARQQNALNVAVHGEVGLSGRGYKRIQDHQDLKSGSPLHFRLLQVTLHALFPARVFRMQSHIVFHCTALSHAIIGESILSLMAASYVRAAGFNKAQAAESVGSIKDLTTEDWNQVCIRLKTPAWMYLKNVGPNIATFHQMSLNRHETASADLAQLRRNHEFAQLSRQIEQVENRIRAKGIKWREELDQAAVEVEKLRNRAKETVDMWKDQHDQLESLRRFARDLSSIDSSADAVKRPRPVDHTSAAILVPASSQLNADDKDDRPASPESTA